LNPGAVLGSELLRPLGVEIGSRNGARARPNLRPSLTPIFGMEGTFLGLREGRSAASAPDEMPSDSVSLWLDVPGFAVSAFGDTSSS
jgi:hypothetical protein